MSTAYRLLSKVSAQDLFDGRLEKQDVREHVNQDETNGEAKWLTDGRNYLRVSIDDDGYVDCISRYGGNAPSKVLNTIAEAFNTDFVSEYGPQFYGFDTHEEWDAWNERMSREADEHFYDELLKYLRGKPCEIYPSTLGMKWAQAAKMMIEQDPSLSLPENKDRLLKELDERGQGIAVTLSPEDLARVQMLRTHEDDLPCA